MTEKRIPIFTFTQRIGNTNFTVRAYCECMHHWQLWLRKGLHIW